MALFVGPSGTLGISANCLVKQRKWSTRPLLLQKNKYLGKFPNTGSKSPQHFVHGQPGDFTLDIPKRQIDGVGSYRPSGMYVFPTPLELIVVAFISQYRPSLFDIYGFHPFNNTIRNLRPPIWGSFSPPFRSVPNQVLLGHFHRHGGAGQTNRQGEGECKKQIQNKISFHI